MSVTSFQNSGFTLIPVMEPDLCSDDPTRKLVRQILGAFSEYEKTMIVRKLRGARQRKKLATGSCEGVKPYGHFPGESAVIDRIQALRAEGLSYQKIATALNSEGFKSREGGIWHPAVVQRISKAQA